MSPGKGKKPPGDGDKKKKGEGQKKKKGKGQKGKKVFRYPAICIQCDRQVPRLGDHLTLYCKGEEMDREDVEMKARDIALGLLKNTKLRKKTIKNIFKTNPNPNDTYRQIIKHMRDLGHFIDSDEQSGSEIESHKQKSPSPSRQKRKHSSSRRSSSPDRKRRRKIPSSSPSSPGSSHSSSASHSPSPPKKKGRKDSSPKPSPTPSSELSDANADPVLKEMIRKEKRTAKIYDPRRNTSYTREVHSKSQDEGLYRRLSMVRFLIRYKYKNIKKLSARILKANVAMIARMLAFIIEKNGHNLKVLKKDQTIADMLTFNKINAFLNALESIGHKPETRIQTQKAVESFLDFIIYFAKVTAETRERIRRMKESITYDGKGTRRDRDAARQDKAVQDFRQLEENRTSVHDIREVFRQPDNVQKIETTKELIIDSGGTIEETYLKILRYTVAKLILYNFKRTQVAENLTIAEFFNNREVQSEGKETKYVFAVRNHKTARKGQLEPVAISKEEKEELEFYFEHCRQDISPIEDSQRLTSEEPFFINHKYRTKLTNVSAVIKAYGRQIGQETFVTSCLARHIAETEASMKYWDNPPAQTAIHNLLSHPVSYVHYIDARPQQAVPGAHHLDELENIAYPSQLAPSSQQQPEMESSSPHPSELDSSSHQQSNLGSSSHPQSGFASSSHQDRPSTPLNPMLVRSAQQRSPSPQTPPTTPPRTRKQKTWREKRLQPSPSRGTEVDVLEVQKKKMIEKYIKDKSSQVPKEADIAKELGLDPETEGAEIKAVWDALNYALIQLRTQHLSQKFDGDQLVRGYLTATEQEQEEIEAHIHNEMNAFCDANKWRRVPLARFLPSLKRHLRNLPSSLPVDPPEQQPSSSSSNIVAPPSSTLEIVDPPPSFTPEIIDPPPSTTPVIPSVPWPQYDARLLQARRTVPVPQASSSSSNREKLSFNQADWDNYWRPRTTSVIPTPTLKLRKETITKISKIYSDQELLEHCKHQSWEGVVVKPDLPGRGRGVFVKPDMTFAKGTVICDYKGKLVEEKKHEKELEKLEREGKHDEVKKIKEYRMIFKDPTLGSNKRYYLESHKEIPNRLGRLINHTGKKEHVNVYLKPQYVLDPSTNERKLVVLIRADKKIEPGKELLYTYSKKKEYSDEPWFEQCPCDKCQPTVHTLESSDSE